MTPEEIVTSVFAGVRARDHNAVADLYAEDGRLIDNAGTVHEGREAIRAFYHNVVTVTKPNPQVIGLFVNTPMIAAVIEAGNPHRGLASAIDVFHVENGAIREMRICSHADVPAPA